MSVPRRTRAKKTAQKGTRTIIAQDTKRTVLYNNVPSMPDEFDTKIRVYGNILASAATLTVLTTIHTNSLLHSGDDIGSFSFATPLSSIGRNYTKYRVVSYKMEYTLLPRSSTLDSNVLLITSPNDQSANFPSGSAFRTETVARDKTKLHIVPRNTSSPCVVSGTSSYPMIAVIGNPEFQQDDKYVGTLDATGVPTSPTDLTYAYFYAGGTTGTYAASTSPSVHVVLTQYVKFYDRRY